MSLLFMPKYFEHSASPLYAQVADAMRERIVKGIWPIDEKIPTLPALAQGFGVGLITVRQAVQLLKTEGLLAPKQGQGTFVLRKPETHPRMQVESSLEGLAELYRRQSPRLIPLEESFSSPHLDEEDGIAAPRYKFLRRIHATERQFTSVISAYIDERVFNLAPQRFLTETVIPVLMDLKAIKIGSARQILTISTAGEDAANALNISVSAPVAEVRRVICANDGTVIYVANLTYRGDYIHVDMNLLA
jgi:GntR family transcriptional regulator